MASSRSNDIRLGLSLDEIIEQAKQKNQSNRASNIAAFCKEEVLDEPMDLEDGRGMQDCNDAEGERECKEENKMSFRRRFSPGSERKNNTPNKHSYRRYRGRFRGYQVGNCPNRFAVNRNFNRRTKNQQRQLNNSRGPKRGITKEQWTYLHHLRRIRNAQGFSLIGQHSPPSRIWTSNPTGSVIYPLTRNVLNNFNCEHDMIPGVSLLTLRPSAISCGSVHSHTSNLPKSHLESRLSVWSHKSDRSNQSTPIDPEVVADEIAQIQSNSENRPDFNVIYETNRKPVDKLNNFTTNIPLSSRFSAYYSPKEQS